MLFEAFLGSIGYLPAFADLAGEFHLLGIEAISFDEFLAIMAEKYYPSSVRIESDLLFPIGRDIDEIALDTIETAVFAFWRRWGRRSAISHIGQL